MKKALLLILFCLFSSQVFADSGSILQDGFGGLSLKMTKINGKSAYIAGFRGGWIMNHSYVVGAGIYVLANNIDAPDGVSEEDKGKKLRFGCIGLEAEYIGKWNKRIHYTIHSLAGIGGLYYRDEKDYVDEDSGPSFNDALFVFEPTFNIEVNVSKKFRIATGVSYRAVAGVGLTGLDNSDIGGPGVSIVVKYGGYR